MSDVIAALRTLLLATPNCEAEIFGIELPRTAVGRMPIDAIVLQPSGGVPLTGASSAALEAQRIDLVCYAATPQRADELRRWGGRAMLAIRRQVAAATLIHWVNSAGGFSAARESDGHWPQSIQSFQIFHSTEEVE